MSSAAAFRPNVARVDDPVVSASELDAFPCHGIEVDPKDHPTERQSPDGPASETPSRSKPGRAPFQGRRGFRPSRDGTIPRRPSHSCARVLRRGILAGRRAATPFSVVLTGPTIVIAAIVFAGGIVGGHGRYGVSPFGAKWQRLTSRVRERRHKLLAQSSGAPARSWEEGASSPQLTAPSGIGERSQEKASRGAISGWGRGQIPARQRLPLNSRTSLRRTPFHAIPLSC
jgi:hypothetical protein